MAIYLDGFRELKEALGASEVALERAFRNVMYAFSQEASAVIETTLIQAAAQAGPDAFPPQYVGPMIEASQKIVITTPSEVQLDFDQMGTIDDLTLGYHYGAKLADGGQVDLPWDGGQGDGGLKNDVTKRYEAWLRVFYGDTWHGLDYSGSWSETIAARLDAWGDKAPQWLLLEYGQTEWEPTIEPFPIVEDITSELYGLFEGMLASEVERVVEALNRPIPQVPTGAVYDVRGRGSRARDLRTGRFL